MHFFIKFLCSPILMELDQDIWQIIFELVIFYEIATGKALSLSSFVQEGGGSGLWITLYSIQNTTSLLNLDYCYRFL